MGLRGFERRPRRVRCPAPDCEFRGWDDGGVNDDLGRHLRHDHDPAAAATAAPEVWATVLHGRKPHRFPAGQNRSACGKWARLDIYGEVTDPPEPCRPCQPD
jgi:hypothetical protein